MTARSYVVVALAAAGAAAGGLALIGPPPTVAVAPVNCVTESAARGSTSVRSVLDGAEESAGRSADDGSAGSGSLASRARGGSESASADVDPADVSAEELAQALADALAGSTQPAARRLAVALADEGFVAADDADASARDASAQDTSVQDGTGRAAAADRRTDAGATAADCAEEERQDRANGGATGGRAADEDPREPALTGQRRDAAGEPAERTGARARLDDEGDEADEGEVAERDADDAGQDRGIESVASVLERVGADSASGGGRG